MPLYYLDSSALVKAYIEEPGSAWVSDLSKRQPIAISSLNVAELGSAFGRRQRSGDFSPTRRDELFQTFLRDAIAFAVIDVSQAILERASQLLLEGLPVPTLRSLDALHLATAQQALETESDRALVSADKRRLQAAAALGLPTENPEDHE